MIDFRELHLHWGESEYKGVKYRSYSLARAFREDGKNKKEIVVKLGKLSDEQVERWKAVLHACKEKDAVVTNLDDILVDKNYQFLDVAAVNAIWDRWGFNELFPAKGKRTIDVAHVAKILTINRCIDPVSKYSTVNWFKQTALSIILNIEEESFNASRIYRELDHIENSKELICSHIFSKLRRESPETLQSTFYDLSTSIFHGSKCVLVEWGRAKEGYQDHIVLAIAVNSEGIPFFWEVYRGGTSDIKAFTYLIQKLNDKFSSDGMTLTFDRGMVSDANLDRLEKDRIKYVTALDKDQIEIYANFDFTEVLHYTPESIETQLERRTRLQKFDATTYFREAGLKDKRRYILGFNSSLFKAQREIREKNIGDFIKYIDEMNRYLEFEAERPNDVTLYKKIRSHMAKYNLSGFISLDIKPKRVQRYNPELEENILVNTYRVRITIDDQNKRVSGKLDGFWLLVTNHTEKEVLEYAVSPQKIIQTYRDKFIVEDAFRDVKSFIEISPTYLWTEKHVKAHYTICALAHLINRSIALYLKENDGGKTDYIKTASSVYQLLSECRLNKLEIKNHYANCLRLTKPTDAQKELLNRLNLEHILDSCAELK